MSRTILANSERITHLLQSTDEERRFLRSDLSRSQQRLNSAVRSDSTPENSDYRLR
ncbi:hypothetical protein [Saccharibacter floricola]|uniref:hypothetical protein n=1 Tax=Saccharibacter floricola TaxID=231053 RepID=UPI00146C2372|nr:hypothetical protein [Saccharibacter floricola]